LTSPPSLRDALPIYNVARSDVGGERPPAALPAAFGSASLARTSFVDPQRAAAEILAVQLRDRRLGFALIRHLDEPEAAGAARFADRKSTRLNSSHVK